MFLKQCSLRLVRSAKFPGGRCFSPGGYNDEILDMPKCGKMKNYNKNYLKVLQNDY
jgi:hypothetical protein